MIELNADQYPLVKSFINKLTCDTVYPHSIVERNQRGRIFVDSVMCPKTVLFWHYCSFAFIIGENINDEFNQKLSKLLLGEFEKDQRRFILAVNDDEWNKVIKNIVDKYPQIQSGYRFMFRFIREKYYSRNFSIPDGFEIVPIEKELIEKLEGRVIPSFSWHPPDAFLDSGKGFCLIDKMSNDIICNAFSASIGNGKIDIGIETKSEYRGKGFGPIVAAQMVQYALDNGYEPVWGCDTKNLGSASVARKLGFEDIGFHSMYVKQKIRGS